MALSNNNKHNMSIDTLKSISTVVDDEWSSFILNTSKYNGTESDTESDIDEADVKPEFINDLNPNGQQNQKSSSNTSAKSVAPEPTPIYISTKSKIAYLVEPIDLNIFWGIPVMPYATPSNGVIKKQIKFNSKTQEELNIIQSNLQNELFCEQQVMTHIDNPNGRIKFKDIRKITIGISKKDIMSYRGKKKQAFYNCFVIIIRLKMNELFREFHVKVFNTGKLEIPGVQSDEMFEIVLQNIIAILQPHIDTQISYKQKSDTVLINSNFNCGFYINREVLYDLLKYKYHIHAIYDPCSYPGIQCKFYFNNESTEQTGIQDASKALNTKDKYKNNELNAKALKVAKADKVKDLTVTTVSFMIFRTGSVLIVGMCEEYVLDVIYGFLTNLLKTEFGQICQSVFDEGHVILKDKKKKIRKKTIVIMIEPLPTNGLPTNGLPTNGLPVNVLPNVLPVNGLHVNVLPNVLPTVKDTLDEEFIILCKPSKKSKKVKPSNNPSSSSILIM
jgi:hypothetical protein